jgi:hypothetical protein
LARSGGSPSGDIARRRSVRVLAEDDGISEAIDVRRPVRLAMEYDVKQAGFKLVAIFSLSNEERRALFTVLDSDRTWRMRPHQSESIVPEFRRG